MKRVVFLILLLAGTSLGTAGADSMPGMVGMDNGSANSHSTVSTMLMISPASTPVAGKPVKLNFTVQDTAGHFAVQSCLCRVTVQHDGRILLDKAVRSGSGSDFSLPYTFPRGGAYSITLSGIPSQSTAFHPFAVSYQQVVRSKTNLELVILGVICFLASLVLLAVELKRRATSRNSSAAGSGQTG